MRVSVWAHNFCHCAAISVQVTLPPLRPHCRNAGIAGHGPPLLDFEVSFQDWTWVLRLCWHTLTCWTVSWANSDSVTQAAQWACGTVPLRSAGANTPACVKYLAGLGSSAHFSLCSPPECLVSHQRLIFLIILQQIPMTLCDEPIGHLEFMHSSPSLAIFTLEIEFTYHKIHSFQVYI